MLKCLSNTYLKKGLVNAKRLNYFNYNNFGRKTVKKGNEPGTPDAENENPDDIKVSFGTFPYLPLNDHPLIPGYGRLLAVTSEITEKLKEINAEKTKIVVSVVKNPEKIEALQAAMYNLHNI
jgi:hypothetical protein